MVVMGALSRNVSVGDTQRKRDSVASYFAVSWNDAGHVFGEYEWDGKGRRTLLEYRSSDAIGPGFQHKPVNLVNGYSSQCLTSSGGPGTAASLGASREGQGARRGRPSSGTGKLYLHTSRLSLHTPRERGFQVRRSSALLTTLTLLNAIAAPATIGFSRPNAANGTPIRL